MPHLRFDVGIGYNGPHAQTRMREMGITYQHATPQSMADQWWFWNCENIPNPLPEYLSVMEKDPMKCVGHGLSQADAEKIRDYAPPSPHEARP